jgi:hypothetical protein
MHFPETDFKVGDKTRLERSAIPNPFTVASHSISAQHRGGPSSNSSSFEEFLHVLVPTKTYYKKSKTSLTEDTIQIHSETSLPSFISPDMSVPAETSTFSKEDTSFPLVSGNESASGEELGSVKPSKFFHKAYSTALSHKRSWFGQSGKTNSMQKEVV